MKIHQDKKTFKALIARASDYLKINQAFIEKDYWVMLVLKRLSESKNKDNFIFKGGTSLSKAHKIIERFSEDVDLAVVINEKLSNNQVKKLIDSTSKEITKDIEEVEIEGLTSKHSRFRKTAHKYPIISESSLFGEVLTNLVLEINSFAQPHPNNLIEIEAYITTFLKSAGQDEFIKEYNLFPFQIRVLGLERTLGEKVLALIRASYSDEPIKQLKIKIRHIYDIYMILQKREMLDFFESESFFILLRDVQEDDLRNSEFQGDWIKKKLSESLIFKNIDLIWRELDKHYQEVFVSLVYGELPTSENIKKVLKKVSLRLKEFDKSNIKSL